MNVTVFNPLDAYAMFKRGMDTLEIANLSQRPEHEVLREINQRRSRELRKPYPYAPHAQPAEISQHAPRFTTGAMSKRNRDILKRRRAGQNFEQIAQAHGITPQRVWQIVRENRRGVLS